MSSDVVACPQCGANLQNSESIAGQIVMCPHCQSQLQMPVLSQATATPQLPAPAALPAALELPPTTNAGASSGIPSSAPLIQPKRSKQNSATSVTERLRKRTNPLAYVLAAAFVVILVAVGVVSVRWDRAEKAKKQFTQQLIGNWELEPGQSQMERWDFAFHADHQLQMAVGDQLSEGRWRVTAVRGSTGYVLIDWPDDAPETMRVRFEGGTMQIELDSVGNFAFRAAQP